MRIKTFLPSRANNPKNYVKVTKENSTMSQNCALNEFEKRT